MEPNSQSRASWFWGEGWSRFGAFAVLGGLSILAAHALFPQALWPIAVFAFLLMVAFGYSEWRFKIGQEDRLGDDLYYLGLTYTLVSVAHALWAFAGVLDVDKLVSDFGVALLTTLAGIVSRVLLYEKHASQKRSADTDQGMAQLRIEIEGAIGQMQEFRRGLALNLQQAGDSAVQSMSTAFASLSSSANGMGEAAKAMNASLKRGASAFDKTIGRIGETSDALGKRVSELVEGTKALKSVSDDLNGVMDSLKESVEQQSNLLTATLEPLKETTLGTRKEFESLTGSISPLAQSIGELTRQIETAKEEFNLIQLKKSVSDARDAAEDLRQNLRSVADTLAPGEADFSAMKAFANGITEFTGKVDECTLKLARLAEQSDNTPHTLRQISSALTDVSAAHDPRSPVSSNAPSEARANGYLSESGTKEPVESKTHSSPRDNKEADHRDSAPDARSRAWWPWRRD
jgi:methyl-accepting chemotaxis protein